MHETYLVTMATGRQGFSTARELAKHGKIVHALVRNKDSIRANELRAFGCILFQGSLDDTTVVEASIAGVTGIFVNIFPDFQDSQAEIRQVNNLLSAASSAGTVSSVVVTTALNTSKHPEWLAEDSNYPMAYYYSHKYAIEEAVRASDIRYRTILRPGFLMHDYLEPMWRQHYPNYQSQHCLEVAYPPEARTAHFDPADVGKFAAAAFLDPDCFNGAEIELGNEQLTIEEVARKISIVAGLEVRTRHLSHKEIAAIAPRFPALAWRLWGFEQGTFVNDARELERWGIELTPFAKFLEKEAKALKETLLVTGE